MGTQPHRQRIGNFYLNGCHIRLGLDTRHLKRAPDRKCPISIIYQIGNNWRHYVPLNYLVTPEQYDEICCSTGRGRTAAGVEQRPFDIKNDILNTFRVATEKFKQQFDGEERPLTKDFILDFLSGKKSEIGSFTDLWKEFADQLTVDRNEASTGPGYNQARKSFLSLVGEVNGFDISVREVKAWDDAMKQKVSSTTRGIYLRAMRAAWKEAQQRGLISKDNYPFGRGPGKVSIPTGGSRKENYLDVSKMMELYRIFINKDYPGTLPRGTKESVHKNLGLFLLEYLCNGCDMADLARIRYGQHFFNPEGQQLLFFRRTKTVGRNELVSEICVPIIPQLAAIMEQIAAPAIEGELIFPQIYRGIENPNGRKSRVAQVNKEIREHVRMLTKCLGWNEQPGSSWARHSFATNLRHCKAVPQEYIDEAMAHAEKTVSVTTLYQARYPVSDLMLFNSYLLRPAADLSVGLLSEEELEMLRKFREKKNRKRKKTRGASGGQ